MIQPNIPMAASTIALLNRRYYPDIWMGFALEESQSLGWAVKKGEDSLREQINGFFRKIKEDGTFQKIYEKYYSQVEIFDYFDLKKFHERIETRLPKYRDTIQKASQKYGFDWRLIAAMIYQESHFDPQARSYTGVKGIMQITLDTARELGVKERLNPQHSIPAGIRYLKKLYDRFDEAQDPDRLLIALASYNVGRGHILDAQGIARKQGLNPNSWASISQILPLLRKSKYYKNTTYGYCRGTEPVRYVERIMSYYEILKREGIS
jgi:membrane-bound lytic murein transglycosylase F